MTATTKPIPADPNINPRRYSRFWFRFFEILPGALVWTALLAPFFLARYFPLQVIIFIILFDVFWLLRALSYASILTKGYHRFKETLATNWMAQLKDLDQLSHAQMQDLGLFPWKELYHAIIITSYKEEYAVVRAGIESIAKANYPKENLIVVLAIEAREGKPAKDLAASLAKEFEGTFHKFLVSAHPDGMPGEVKAKGANASWAARQLTKLIQRDGVPLDRVIVSTADADSRFHKDYFACLSYKYLTTEKRVQACFQPVAMYFNNIWETPMISRIMAFNTTFWQLTESVRDYRLISFATHAASLQTLHDINYWCTSIVNEDSRQFFRGYFHYNGHFRSIPLFMPIYMDAVSVGRWRLTMRNLYLQQQRWAYGVEHFPYIVLESFRRKKIAWGSRFILIFRAFSGSFTWATAAFFITVVGWLPLILSPDFQEHITSFKFPTVTRYLLSLTWVGLLLAGILTLRLLNMVFAKQKTRADFAAMLIQWLLVPVVSLVFGAAPGIDAQTRLMFGKYLGFRVTEKKAL